MTTLFSLSITFNLLFLYPLSITLLRNYEYCACKVQSSKTRACAE